MPSVSTHRRLVKSPPELWAEISDADALAKHLDGFGEIRITRVVPETTVAWEGDRASGTVEIETSGWGTKVVLTAAVVDPPPPVEQVETVSVALVPAEVAEQIALTPAPIVAEPASAVLATEVEPVALAIEVEPKSGFFARLFGRKAQTAPVQQTTAPAARPAPTRMAPTSAPAPVMVAEPEREPVVVDPEPVAVAVEPVETSTEPSFGEDRALEILTGVLDDLGSAHHRPFSRG